ncbi:unnamed protein product [Cylindrotheca closterium]|uniref:Uncharacterized protein n=1 Tax=Cylindrotheca closterium TaxID=2856 RepID=A0AAD2JL42_9STRA|nr:unnamed protein product [Cylindrotheca closterium]
MQTTFQRTALPTEQKPSKTHNRKKHRRRTLLVLVGYDCWLVCTDACITHSPVFFAKLYTIDISMVSQLSSF